MRAPWAMRFLSRELRLSVAATSPPLVPPVGLLPPALELEAPVLSSSTGMLRSNEVRAWA